MITQEDIDAFQRFNDVDYLFNEYQDMAASTAIYKQEHQVIYPALGLAAEAGEVANKVKKILRDKTYIAVISFIKNLCPVIFNNWLKTIFRLPAQSEVPFT